MFTAAIEKSLSDNKGKAKLGFFVQHSTYWLDLRCHGKPVDHDQVPAKLTKPSKMFGKWVRECFSRDRTDTLWLQKVQN